MIRCFQIYLDFVVKLFLESLMNIYFNVFWYIPLLQDVQRQPYTYILIGFFIILEKSNNNNKGYLF